MAEIRLTNPAETRFVSIAVAEAQKRFTDIDDTAQHVLIFAALQEHARRSGPIITAEWMRTMADTADRQSLPYGSASGRA